MSRTRGSPLARIKEVWTFCYTHLPMDLPAKGRSLTSNGMDLSNSQRRILSTIINLPCVMARLSTKLFTSKMLNPFYECLSDYGRVVSSDD